MQFVSTRGGVIGSYSEVVIGGLAGDGGLAVPDSVPRIDSGTLSAWRDLEYRDLACAVVGLFATDIATEDLRAICASAYAPEKFTSPRIVPVTELRDGFTLVGLSEGPTLAFKDIAMQFLAELMDYLLAKSGGVLNILAATSGDTGSSAEYAIRGRERISAFVLSPNGRMSEFQRAQMFSLTEPNIHNIVVDGVFDDCQTLLKELSEDAAFKQEHHLGAVNSINFGRISAQIAYYVWAWLRATDEVPADRRNEYEISVAVPSGNFGNVLSGHYARQMGVPIRKLIVATNENNVLDEFFKTGIYRPRDAAHTLVTSSPSMDVSKASNLERFIFDLLGRDPRRLSAYWAELAERGEIDLSAEQTRFLDEFGIVSGTSTHEDRIETIRTVFASTGTVIDPHTADGYGVARSYDEAGVPMLVLETAKPAKFTEVIEEALEQPADLDEDQRAMLGKEQRMTRMPVDSGLLRSFIAERALV